MGQIHQLNDHNVIALDFDETLVGHLNSPLLQRYVRAHHEQKTFWILTFRYDEWASEVWRDLERYGTGLTRAMFAGVAGCPRDLMLGFYATASTSSRDHPALYYWKGSMARELKCTVLVDDREDWVLPGCLEHEVAFLNTEDL